MILDVVYDNSSYPVGFDDITLPEAFRIKELTGLPLGKFQPAVFDFDPDAVLALVVLALGRSGNHAKVHDIDRAKVDLPRLIENADAALRVVIEAARKERAAQASTEPDEDSATT